MTQKVLNTAMSETVEISVENIPVEQAPIEEPEIVETIGIELNPDLIAKPYTYADLAEIYAWAYNNAVFDILTILFEASQKLLNDQVMTSTERGITYALGVKSAADLINDGHTNFDQAAFRENITKLLRDSGI